jgi:RNA polymerase sigma-70 factor (ECF subfamily)
VADEAELVRRAKKHDKAAFAALYESHFDRVYRYVYLKMGNKHDAEDVTQMVFIKAIEKIHTHKDQGAPFSAWLFRIAHNQIVDLARKNKKRRHEDIDPNIASDEVGPSEYAETRFEVDRMVVATQQLTLSQREVLNLRFAGGLSIAEAAKLMGKSEGAIKALQHSAVAALRKLMTVSHGETATT